MPFTRARKVRVKYAGPNLVAAFPAADPPLVWTFDLERNHSFTIALQGEEGDWELGLTSPKGEFYPVAHFRAREDADEALAKVQKVLMTRRFSVWMALARFVGCFLLLAFLLLMAGYFLVSSHIKGAGLIPSAAPPVKMEDGVPMPADQVLRPPD